MKLTQVLPLAVILLASSSAARSAARAQGTVPSFQFSVDGRAYTLTGNEPSDGKSTSIPTLLVPIRLEFARTGEKQPVALDARPDAPSVIASPVFSPFPFESGPPAQYGDALLRASFGLSAESKWHTVLAQPAIQPVTIPIPAGFGYILSSNKSGTTVAVVDIQFLQKELFRRLENPNRKMVVAVTHNTTFYADGDATVCCSSGTHGINKETGASFVLSSFFADAPAIVESKDVQPLTEQLAEFLLDPLHDPLLDDQNGSGNQFPRWLRPASMRPGDGGACGGTGVASRYFLLEPTDTNRKNNFPSSKPFVATSGGRTYHLQNVALLGWYTGVAEGLGHTFSFPDQQVLQDAAAPCPGRKPSQMNDEDDAEDSSTSGHHAPIPNTGDPNGHKLIGYWEGYRETGPILPFDQISPQWDVIIVAFAIPDKNAPEGTMRFQPPGGLTPSQFKAEVEKLKKRGKQVMISLGGGGQHFTLADPKRVPNYVRSVTDIVTQYGFDGIDIDFESPSLSINAGDKNFRHPTTPSIVNLITALRQIREHFGPGFLISLVPEGTQVPAGYPSYGGQFGSYLAIANAIRDILSFIDVQDYNTPPLQGLDGEIYQAGSVDYHAAMTELLLHGFTVAGDKERVFEPLPPEKVAIGFLTGDADPVTIWDALHYLRTGIAPPGATYRLRNPRGYPKLLGAMFWTIDADARKGYNFSNVIGPELHNGPASH